MGDVKREAGRMTERELIDAIIEQCAEALYLSERTPSALPVLPYADAAPAVKEYCRRCANAVLVAAVRFLFALP